MRILVLVLTVFLFFVWLGLKIQADPGYVLLAYQHWTLETPLWFAITSIVIGFLIFYMLMRLLNGLGTMTTRWRLWAKQRRLRRAHERTSRGLLAFAEGHWKAAERDLIKASQYTDMPLINYLAAARAAQELGEYEKRDDYLHKAHLLTPTAEVAVGLTQAQLQYSHQQLEQALATLRRIHDLAPKNTYVLRLLQKIYLELRDYESLEALLPELRKYRIISPANEDALMQTIYLGLLSKAEKENSAEMINAVWVRIPKEMKVQPAILGKYVTFLMRTHEMQPALNLLADGIKRGWNAQLVEDYGNIEGPDPAHQLTHAEAWLKSHPNDPALLLTLAKLCLRNQLWGKAKSYLETCLSVSPSPAAYWLLGQLSEKLGDNPKAWECYRNGLAIYQ